MKNMNWFPHMFLISAFLGAAVPFLCLKFLPLPHIWIMLSWFALSVYLAITIRKTAIKIVLVGVSTLLITLAAFEMYVQLTDSPETVPQSLKRTNNMNSSTGKPLLEQHDILGYAAVKSNETKSTLFIGDELLYNVTYTIDEDGLRKPPGFNQEILAGCVLFFGGSFTFGEGLNDKETMPYQVGIKSGGKYRIYNFGFNGYGPHQMLAMFEQGIVKNIVACDKPKTAVYLTHLDHVKRAAGITSWDIHGPEYVLNENNELIYQGHFDDEKNKQTGDFMKGFLSVKRIKSSQYPFSKENILLYSEIVSSVRTRFMELYPDGKFHVLLWDDIRLEQYNTKLINRLNEKGFDVHLTSKVLPGFKENKIKYTLGLHDEHPNAGANALIAGYVVRSILEK